MIRADKAREITKSNQSSLEIENEANAVLEKLSEKIEEVANLGESKYVVGIFSDIYPMMNPEPEGTTSCKGMKLRDKVKEELINAGYRISDVLFDGKEFLKIEW